MAMELQRHAIYFGGQVAKGTENTTPTHRAFLTGGDIALNRDINATQVSDGSKYGAQIRYLNTMTGTGTPAFEATPSEAAALLYLLHGTETFTAGTNNVWTVAGAPASGTFTLNIWDGTQTVAVTGIVNTVTAAALATSINTAMTTAGYTGTPVAAAGGPLNTTAITITFSGVGTKPTAARPFFLSKVTDTTSPAVTLTNTTPGVRAKHAFTPQSTAGLWTTFVKSIGTSTVMRQSFIDCLLGGFTFECSQAQKDARISMPLLCLDPMKVIAADPAAVLPSGVDARPFLFTEGTGTFTLGTGTSTTVVQGTQSVTCTTNEDRSPSYGDDVVPYDFFTGTPAVTLSTTLIFDPVGQQRWNELVYGAATPSTGAKPIRGLPAAGSYTFDIKQKDSLGNLTGNEFKLTFPSLNWDVPEAPAPNPAGGEANFTLGGALAPTGATAAYTIEVWNGDNAAYTQ